MKQFIGFISGFLLCGLLSQFITFAWLTCVLLAAACGFALAWWLFFSLLEPHKRLAEQIIATMVRQPNLIYYLVSQFYPKAMAKISEGDRFSIIDMMTKKQDNSNEVKLFRFMEFNNGNVFLLNEVEANVADIVK